LLCYYRWSPVTRIDVYQVYLWGHKWIHASKVKHCNITQSGLLFELVWKLYYSQMFFFRLFTDRV
jgi:hypothetical protein